jgi:DNA repair protein RecO (recombination protein O)
VAGRTTEALVLRSVAFGESDLIVHLLVPESGRLTAIAKGARRSVRRFPGTLDLFNHLRVQVAARRSAGMARLEQATLIEAFTPLRREPARFALACYLLELLDRLAPEGGARADVRRLFAFALSALHTVTTLRRIDSRLRTLLELRALDALGLCPELHACVRCGGALATNGGEVAFSVADGGPLCAGCRRDGESSVNVHLGTLRALEQGLRFDLERLDRLVLSRQTLEESRRILDRFQRYHTGVELRSERFLDELLAKAH